jgi:two-component system chemotaxis response regulator CheB
VNQLVVIGASAGGVRALATLVAALPAGFAAPIVIVLHIGAHRSILHEILSRAGPLPAGQASEGERIEAGRIYVAPADHHVLVVGDSLRLSRGAKQHHARPAIDPLFLSAAVARGPRAIGVLLTGRLDDGTMGLQAIKACGGVTVIQDPADAEAPDMPASALRHVEIDHCVALPEMADLLVALTGETSVADGHEPPPDALVHELSLSLSKGDPMEHLPAVADPSPYVCPDCRGGLWEVRGAAPRRFRCHTGHAFTIRTLQDTLAAAAEESLWTARRALQERLLLLREMEAEPRGEAIPAQVLEGAASRLAGQLGELELLMEHGPEPIE